ncbi:MAG: urea ABC transporter permease subunit UrtB [Pseudomonadota bacterium]
MLYRLRRLGIQIYLVFIFSSLSTVYALDATTIQQLAAQDSDSKIAAIKRLVKNQDVTAIPLLIEMQNGRLNITQQGQPVALSESGQVKEIPSGKILNIAPEALQTVTVNNRLRSSIEVALAALRLSVADHNTRLRAAQELTTAEDEELLELLERSLAKESAGDVRLLLEHALANIKIKSPDAEMRRDAVILLGHSDNPNTKLALANLLEKKADGNYVEADKDVRMEAAKAIAAIDRRLVIPELIGTVFSGLSLGSVLLLTALGLAITFGLMGVINMAHGELMMIGAYATYVVQVVFKEYLPSVFQYYLLIAVPAAFLVSALVGIALERTVIRYLYGRPLETLLATWGISLILIQFVRMIFGAQNVEVTNPAWMSGGWALAGGVVLPYNRMAIIVFAILVLWLVWSLLNRTRLGLYVRAVTQNRSMADCMGIATPRVDWMTFGLGSGIAGLGGVALSQIGNVGPDLGQSYIVDSFLVVVLGGVGQMAGTVLAALGLGELNKFLEPHTGAVLGKICILVLIILFIQKRPQGLFALKGRVTEV